MYIDFEKLHKHGFGVNASEGGVEIYPINIKPIYKELEELTGLSERNVDEVSCLISDLQIIQVLKSR